MYWALANMIILVVAGSECPTIIYEVLAGCALLPCLPAGNTIPFLYLHLVIVLSFLELVHGTVLASYLCYFASSSFFISDVIYACSCCNLLLIKCV